MKNIFLQTKLDWIIFGIFIIVIVLFLVFVFNSNVKNFYSKKYVDEVEKACLDECKKIDDINYNWGLMDL
ncbi:MAG: hypothetical protein ACE5ES_05325 [Candidatus Nanoarchaeia archaeon]